MAQRRSMICKLQPRLRAPQPCSGRRGAAVELRAVTGERAAGCTRIRAAGDLARAAGVQMRCACAAATGGPCCSWRLAWRAAAASCHARRLAARSRQAQPVSRSAAEPERSDCCDAPRRERAARSCAGRRCLVACPWLLFRAHHAAWADCAQRRTRQRAGTRHEQHATQARINRSRLKRWVRAAWRACRVNKYAAQSRVRDSRVRDQPSAARRSPAHCTV